MGFETPTPSELQKPSNAIEQPKPVVEPAGVVQKTRESIMTFLAFNQLKLREYFGKIDESQLQSLLELEFEQSKKDTLPISDIFDPEAELQNLRTLPREQKREALAEFKSKLVRQREAWATCRTFLRRKIEVNHDVAKQDLMDWIDKFSSEYGFTDSQRQTAEEIIDDYYENRQRVKKIRDEYPNDVDLVNELSGQTFDTDTKFKIKIGPMSVNIYCDAFTAGRLFTKKNIPQKIKCPAFACLSNHTPPIKYNVFNRDFLFGQKTNLLHEEQHQENQLFRQQFDQVQDTSDRLFKEYEDESDSETKKALLESYLRAVRDKALVSFKNEVLAYRKAGIDRLGSEGKDFLSQDNSPYDYLAYVRNLAPEKDDQLWQEAVQRVLVDEYGNIVKRTFVVIDDLKKGGFSSEQIIALLSDKPVIQWSKTARRLLEENK